jgi:hypothetical protein
MMLRFVIPTKVGIQKIVNYKTTIDSNRGGEYKIKDMVRRTMYVIRRYIIQTATRDIARY